MKKGTGVRCLYQRGRVKATVARSTENIIGRHPITGKVLGLIGEILNTDIKIQNSSSFR